MKIRVLIAMGFFTIAGFFVINSSGFAHQGATGIVKQRMDSMKDLGALMKQLLQLNWDDVPTAQAKVEAIAGHIARHASEMQKMFPEGSNSHPSEAIDAIWKEEVAFKQAIQALDNAAIKMMTGAGFLPNASALKPHITRLSNSCSACHRDFRKKK